MIRQRTPQEFPLSVQVRIDIEEYYDHIIRPYQKAPAVALESGINVLKPMQFSLVPRWSETPKVKFAWRDAFKNRHCIIPLTDFIEPIYEGEFAGNMVAFHRADAQILLAAGIWEEWVNKETGEAFESFSIITTEPPKYIKQVGHDRCPLFLSEKNSEVWLANKFGAPKEMVSMLLESRYEIEFRAEKQRAMKPGWEKRK
jgi:putative SOS response-associated peptidase YedK